jgi:hypothetical protein
MDKTLRATGLGPGAPENEQDFEREKRALRQLIDQFRRQPESSDDGGFYRNVGRYIARPMLNPYGPGDKGR